MKAKIYIKLLISMNTHKHTSQEILSIKTKCYVQGVPKNSVTNSISSLLLISIVIPNFKSHNTILSARVYFMKRVKDCKDVSMSPHRHMRNVFHEQKL